MLKCVCFLHCCKKELPDVGSCELKHVVQYYVTFKCCVGRWIAVVCGIFYASNDLPTWELVRECFIFIQLKIITDAIGLTWKVLKMLWRKMPGSWWREIGGMLQGIGTAGWSFWRRPWLKRGCCANDDDERLTKPNVIWYDIFVNCNWVVTRWQKYSTHLHTNNT